MAWRRHNDIVDSGAKKNKDRGGLSGRAEERNRSGSAEPRRSNVHERKKRVGARCGHPMGAGGVERRRPDRKRIMGNEKINYRGAQFNVF